MCAENTSIVFLLLLCLTHFCNAQDVDPFADIIDQAHRVADEGRKEDAANLLRRAYEEAESIESKVQLLNIALQYYSETGNSQTIKTLTQNAIASIRSEDEDYFHEHSQAYGFLAQYYLQEEKSQTLAEPLLIGCSRTERNDIRTWCRKTLDSIMEEHRQAYLSSLNDNIEAHKIGYGFICLLFLVAFGAFGLRTLSSEAT